MKKVKAVIFKKDLKESLRMFLVWTVPIVVLSVWMMSLFTTFEDSSAMLEFVEQFPLSFRKAFGIDRLSVWTLEGYFGTEVHLFILLFGGIFACLLGSGILSKEGRGNAMEFLLSKPVSRNRILLSKASVYMVLLFAFNAIVWASSYVAITRYDTPFDQKGFWLLAEMTLGVHLVFGSLGFLGAAIAKRNASFTSASIGLVLSSYAIKIAADIGEGFEFLGHISPFRWASAPDILSESLVSPGHVLATITVIAASLAVSFLVFGRKDMLF